MGKPHWYIKTYVGDSPIRVEGRSTRTQLLECLKEYHSLEDFAPNNSLEERDNVTIAIMSKSSTGIRKIHMMITTSPGRIKDPDVDVYLLAKPIIFHGWLTPQLTRELVFEFPYTHWHSYPSMFDISIDQLGLTWILNDLDTHIKSQTIHEWRCDIDVTD